MQSLWLAGVGSGAIAREHEEASARWFSDGGVGVYLKRLKAHSILFAVLYMSDMLEFSVQTFHTLSPVLQIADVLDFSVVSIGRLRFSNCVVRLREVVLVNLRKVRIPERDS